MRGEVLPAERADVARALLAMDAAVGHQSLFHAERLAAGITFKWPLARMHPCVVF